METLFRKEFVGADFAAIRAAEDWLEDRGFSCGRGQRGAPRGILFGEWDIQKWRNLNERERSELHGQIVGDSRDGPVAVEIFDTPLLPEPARTVVRYAIAAQAAIHAPKRKFALTIGDALAFDALPDSWQALLKSAGRGTPYEQLALDFAIPIGTVRSRLNRARNKIEAHRQTAEAA